MRYECPESVEAAVQLLSGEAGKVHVLAGGTDLLVRLRSGFVEPDVVVDLKRIGVMRGISEEDGGLRIGAAVPSAELNEHDRALADYPGVCEGAGLIGSTQIQGRATLAGNLCNASPAADSVPAMVTAGATVRVVGPDGSRDVPVEEIPTGPGKTQLKKGEFVESIFLPKRGPRSSDAYLRFIPRTEMDIAVAGAAVSLTLDEAGTVTEARVALGAVSAVVMRLDAAADALIGTKLEDEALDRLAALCSEAASPIDDKRGTVEYRKKVAGVLARRAAVIAYERAKAKG